MNYKLKLDELSTPKQILLADPLRESTKKLRRNLLATTMIVLVASSYGADKIELPLNSLPADVILGAIGCAMVYFMFSFIIHYAQDIQGWHVAQRNNIGENQLKALMHLSERLNEIDFEIRNVALNYSSYEQVLIEQLDRLIQPVNKLLENYKDSKVDHEAICEIQSHIGAVYDLATCKSGGSNVISEAVNGIYKGELVRLSGAVGYFEDSVRHYNKLVKIIHRESLQLRILQYLIHYGWEAVLPICLFFLAYNHSSEAIYLFVSSIFS